MSVLPPSAPPSESDHPFTRPEPSDLRDEFSIGERFAKVEHKINHVQSNTKFFLEILNHQKSNKLEWIIIVLISAEIVISCADLYHQLLG